MRAHGSTTGTFRLHIMHSHHSLTWTSVWHGFHTKLGVTMILGAILVFIL